MSASANRSYEALCNRRRSQYGQQFSAESLAPQFVRFYETGQRIIVETKYGETLRGYVGVTTGWKPCFLLMHNTRSISSSNTLSADDKIIGTVNKFDR